MTKFWLWIKVAWAALSSRSNQAFYDRISSIYDEVFVVHRVHAETILKVINDISSDREKETLVLDLGCGTGMLSMMLDEKGVKVVGLDISFSSLCVLRQHNPRFNVIQADANCLPFTDEAFSNVVCLGVWRHFSDLQKALNQVSRVLSSDGAFIVGYFPPNIAGSIHVKQNLWGWLLINLYQLFTRRFGYLDRADFLLEEETEEAFRNRFKIVTQIASDFNKHLLLARYPITRHTSHQVKPTYDINVPV
jgi:ubiquinone/menaquinone biosynthesis C-methylase UbiE